jgi:hypothetical protein
MYFLDQRPVYAATLSREVSLVVFKEETQGSGVPYLAADGMHRFMGPYVGVARGPSGGTCSGGHKTLGEAAHITRLQLAMNSRMVSGNVRRG